MCYFLLRAAVLLSSPVVSHSCTFCIPGPPVEGRPNHSPRLYHLFHSSSLTAMVTPLPCHPEERGICALLQNDHCTKSKRDGFFFLFNGVEYGLLRSRSPPHHSSL